MPPWFFPPHFEQPEKTQAARFIHYLLWIMIVFTTLAQIVNGWLESQNVVRYLIVIAVIDGSGLIMLYLLSKGAVNQVGNALILITWATVTWLAITDGGIRAPEATAFFIIVFASGFVLGERAGVLTAVVCILTELLLVNAQDSGVLPPSSVHHNNFTVWIIYATFFLVIAAIQFLATRTIHETYIQANRELAERRHAEAALRESEERFQRVLSGSPIFSYITDKNLRYKWIYNPPPILAGKQLVGLRDDEIFPSEAAQKLVDFKMGVLAAGKGDRQEIDLTIDDQSFIFDVNAEPFRDRSERITGLLVTSMDVTETRRIEIERVQSQTQLELHRLLIQNQEAQRLRIAQDLHDGPVQELVGSTLVLQGVLMDSQDARVNETVSAVKRSLQAQIETLREYAGDLRSPVLVRFGLEKAIQSRIETLKNKYPDIRMIIEASENEPAMSEEIRLSLYRIFQEAMNNILRHAQATEVAIRIVSGDHQIRLEIQDNGIGFQTAPDLLNLARQGHFGLVGIYEQANAIGAKVDLHSTPGDGAILRVDLDLPVPISE
jgi:signal transduction histidine kinase